MEPDPKLVVVPLEVFLSPNTEQPPPPNALVLPKMLLLLLPLPLDVEEENGDWVCDPLPRVVLPKGETFDLGASVVADEKGFGAAADIGGYPPLSPDGLIEAGFSFSSLAEDPNGLGALADIGG